MDTKEFIQELMDRKMKEPKIFPDKKKAEAFIEEMFYFLFVSDPLDNHSDVLLSRLALLEKQLASLLMETLKDETSINKQTSLFFDALPSVYEILWQDADAVYHFDPAAQELYEVIMAYPGFFATVIYRLSHQLWKQGIRLLPRLFCEYAHSKTGIDIHPGAVIGPRFAIDHGTGIVIGETSIIGKNVKIYQGVTLGALHVEKSLAQIKRHPTIKDNVVIYSGATILGGSTIIGEGSIIGGNVWLTQTVPPNSVVYHKSEIKIKDKDPFPEPFNFII